MTIRTWEGKKGVAALAVLSLLFTVFPVFKKASALPADFQDTVVFSGLNTPTAVRFAPNGKIFVAEKAGIIKVYDGVTDTTATTFADLRAQVQDAGDRGLLSIAIHPNFPTQPFVYAFFGMDAPIGQTPPVYNDNCPEIHTDCLNGSRLVKLTAAGDVSSSQQILIEDWCGMSTHHSSGDMAFGTDGSLYLSHGDGGTAAYVDYGQQGTNGCADPANEGGAMHAQDIQTMSDPVNLAGTLIRINPDTGAAMPDNPLIGGNTGDDRIVAYGLRNPFRLALDNQTGNMWIGNVGWNSWEEIERVPNVSDAIVENFGWPCYEGTPRQPGYDAANLPVCEALYTANTSKSPYYEYINPAGGAASISGTAVYRGNNFPSSYSGALFFADYSQMWIKVMMPGGNGLPNPANVVDFIPSGVFPVDLQVGPNGELFYVDIAMGEVHKIQYSPQNAPPVANITADVTNGPAPLTVNFSAATSTDPNPGDTLTYAWDLDGDGQLDDSTAIAPQYTYTTGGNFTVTLRVTDQLGAFSTDTQVIATNNSPPQVSVTTPTAGATFAAGEVINFSGQATDPDSGPLPASAYNWKLILHHCAVGNPQNCHQHFMQEWNGITNGSFTAPDHEYPAHVELLLTATEPAAPNLQTSASVSLQPRTTTLSFNSVPSGLQLSIYGVNQTTPFTREVIQNGQTTISAVTPQVLGGTNYQFGSWSDGGSQTHFINAGTTPQTFTATFTQVTSPSVWNSWDIVPQAGTPQAKVTASSTGTAADIEFYESTNDNGIAKTSLFPVYDPGVHQDGANVENYWSVGAGQVAWPYAGKDITNRGADVGEGSAPAPSGVRDLGVHPPTNTHNVVTAFKAPHDGNFTISNLGVRKTHPNSTGVRLRVYNAQGSQVATLSSSANQNWVTSATPITLSNLTAGQYIYFAIDALGDFFWDTAEIAWTVTAGGTPPPPAPTCTLTVNPTTISQGGTSTLSWTTQNATQLSIDNGIGLVSVGGGNQSVSPSSSTIYGGTATGAGGTGNCSVTLTVVPSDTTGPTVALTAPASGATVSGTSVTVSATASDSSGVAGVQFQVDGNAIGSEDTTSPYSISWNTTQGANGSHSITAVARDTLGNFATSSARTVTVNNDVTSPSVNITSPAQNASITGTVSVAATGSDNVGVAGVQFKLDGNNLGAEDTTSPYSVSWNSTQVSNGSHNLTAVARDAAGNSTTSLSITVFVANPVQHFPTFFTVTTGTFTSGALASLTSDDNNFLVAQSTTSGATRTSVTDFEFSSVAIPSQLDYSIRLKSSASSTTITIFAFNYATGIWTQIHNSTTGTTESAKTASITTGASNYVNAQGKSLVRVQSSRSTTHSVSHELVRLTATPLPFDNTAPVISSVNATGITQTGATVVWATNEGSSSRVEYGTTVSYGSTTSLDASLLTSHSQGLSGLVPATLYHYRVHSVDAFGNAAVSGDSTFTTTTPDTTPPVISNIASGSITSSTTTIAWTTNEGSDTQIEYGPTAGYGSLSTLNPAWVTGHSQTLSGLSANTIYHYRVLSRDGSGNLSTSGDNTFTTLIAPQGPQAVVWINGVNVTVNGNTVTKTSGRNDGTADAGAVSQQQITGNGYLEVTIPAVQAYTYIGLGTNTTNNVSTSIRYALEISGGYVSIRENGVYKSDTQYSIGNIFRIAVENGVVKYYKNGTVFYTSSLAPVYPLVADTAFLYLNDSASNAFINLQ